MPTKHELVSSLAIDQPTGGLEFLERLHRVLAGGFRLLPENTVTRVGFCAKVTAEPAQLLLQIDRIVLHRLAIA